MRLFYLTLLAAVELSSAVGAWGLINQAWEVPSLTHTQNVLLSLALFITALAALVAFMLELGEALE